MDLFFNQNLRVIGENMGEEKGRKIMILRTTNLCRGRYHEGEGEATGSSCGGGEHSFIVQLVVPLSSGRAGFASGGCQISAKQAVSLLCTKYFFLECWKGNLKRPRLHGRRMHNRTLSQSLFAVVRDRETMQTWPACHSAGNVQNKFKQQHCALLISRKSY